MKTPSFLYKAPVEVPNRSGFDKSFSNRITGKCGTLIPVLNKFLIPNTTVDLGMLFQTSFPPMVTDFMGQLDMVFRAYFVPCSLVWHGFEDFATHPTDNPIYPAGTPVEQRPHNIPCFVHSGGSEYYDGNDRLLFGRGTLGDFLGLKTNTIDGSGGPNDVSISMLPFLAYHRIYHDHIRNNVIQAPVFGPCGSSGYSEGGEAGPFYASYLPYISGVDSSSSVDSDSPNVFDISLDNYGVNDKQLQLLDGVSILSLRQSNWPLDYFTAATPRPQAGGEVSVSFATAAEGDDSLMSIASIRQANALQKWSERNNYAGYDYGDQTKLQYGIYPDTSKCKKSLYLGQYVEPVFNNTVMQTAQSSANNSANPFGVAGGVGTPFGRSRSNGKGTLVNNFTASCHGFLMVLAHLRPHADYDTGVHPQMLMREIGDIPFPLLSTVGDQPILNRELVGVSTAPGVDDSSVFGYIDRYAEYKTSLNEVHGELRTGGKLEKFSLKRSFNDESQISSEFLEIPLDFLDDFKTVGDNIVPCDFWSDIYFVYKEISPLPKFSVPTLGDLKYTHTQYVSKRGTGLA